MIDIFSAPTSELTLGNYCEISRSHGYMCCIAVGTYDIRFQNKRLIVPKKYCDFEKGVSVKEIAKPRYTNFIFRLNEKYPLTQGPVMELLRESTVRDLFDVICLEKLHMKSNNHGKHPDQNWAYDYGRIGSRTIEYSHYTVMLEKINVKAIAQKQFLLLREELPVEVRYLILEFYLQLL